MERNRVVYGVNREGEDVWAHQMRLSGSRLLSIEAVRKGHDQPIGHEGEGGAGAIVGDRDGAAWRRRRGQRRRATSGVLGQIERSIVGPYQPLPADGVWSSQGVVRLPLSPLTLALTMPRSRRTLPVLPHIGSGVPL